MAWYNHTWCHPAAVTMAFAAAGWHHVWLYHTTTADPLGQIEDRGCSGHYVGAPGQPDCAYNGVIVPVTSYVAKFEFSATTTSRLKSPMGPATDRFEPKNAFRTKQIRDFAWPVPQTDGEVRQGPKIGANSIARRSNLLKLGRFEPCNFALWRNG